MKKTLIAIGAVTAVLVGPFIIGNRGVAPAQPSAMEPLLIIFAIMTLAFAVLLATKRLLPFKLCLICATISASWLTLLALTKLGVFHDPLLVALLMGQSIVGIYYLLERHAPTPLLVFRWPFLLTLTLIAYSALNWRSSLLPVYWFVLALWILGRIILSYRADPARPSLAKRLIDCCGGKSS
jgi:hypothetical protein